MRRFAQLWLALVALMFGAAPARAGELRVYFFDVGQGDAALIIAPSGKTVLIDAGPPEASARLHARLDELLTAPLDLAILTHAHLDHLGGMEEALGARGARLFMDSGFEHPSPSYESLIKYVQGHKIEMVNAAPGRTIDLGGGASLQLLAPAQPFLSGTPSDANANSVVAKLVFGSRSFLFMGDAEAATEAALISRGVNLKADVLKVAHHGSGASSTDAFLRAVHPSTAVISCGMGNPFNLPSRASTDRLEELGARVLRTDLDGEVRIVSDGKGLQVHTNAEAAPEPLAMVEIPAPPEHAAKGGKHGKKLEATPVEKLADAKVTPTRKDPTPKVVTVSHGPGKYAASQRSEVFHFADCPWAKRIKPENLITFDTREAAVASGRHPAGCCNP